MIEGRSVIAVIPARGGSKGVTKKNIAPCAGKPLLTWTIAAAKASKYVDEILVTSDDDDILALAKSEHTVTTVKRPAELATDEAEMPPVIMHALEYYRYPLAVLLQPTSPLRTGADIDGALELLTSSGATTVTSVYESHAVVFDGTDPKRRQDRKPTLFLSGAVYCFDVARFRETQTLIDSATLPYVMPPERSVDIDAPLDMAIAQTIIASTR